MYAYKIPDVPNAIPINETLLQTSSNVLRSANWLSNNDGQDQIERIDQYGVYLLRTNTTSIRLATAFSANYDPFNNMLYDFVINNGVIGRGILSTFGSIPKDQLNNVRDIIEHNLSKCQTDIYTLVTLQKYRKQLKLTLKRLNQLTGFPWRIIRNGFDEWVLPKYTEPFNPIQLVEHILQMDRAFLSTPRVAPPPVTILPYSSKAEAYFNVKTNTNIPLIGIELELEPKKGKSRDQAFIYTQQFLQNHCIIKSDGSVASGFEVVSKPALWLDQLKEWSPWFEKLNQFMEAKSNCGMHIHMNRRSLSFLQLAKLVEFINREENLNYITHVAGRSPNTYCLLQKENNLTTVGRNLNNNIQTFGNRHVGLNLTNQKTIEFRMFAATTNLDVFQKNIEFVVALRDYFTPGNSTLHPKEQTLFSKFIEWVKQPSNKKAYSKLHQHNLDFNPA